jgi:hypothetical protein
MTIQKSDIRYGELLQLSGNPDFELLKKTLGEYCSAIKSTWIACHFINNWDKDDMDQVRARFVQANESTQEYEFSVASFMDRDDEDDYTWFAGYTLYINKK